MEDKPILFFDGVCSLCSKQVDFLIKRDKKTRLLFSPLQGETAKKLLTQADVKDLDSLVLYHQGKTLRKSTAVLYATAQLGGLWPIINVFYIVPAFIRNWFYSIMANNRYRWFGKSETCRIPTPVEKRSFLD